MPLDAEGNFYIENDHRKDIPLSEVHIKSGSEILREMEQQELAATTKESSSIKLEIRAENETSKYGRDPELDKMLRVGMTAEELLTLANLDGKITKSELDNIELDAKNEGKTLGYQKFGAGDRLGKETKEEIDGREDGSIRIVSKDSKSYFEKSVDFDAAVPMKDLPLPYPQQSTNAVDAGVGR